MIWDEVFFELIVPFDRLVSMKKILWGSSHHIETHIDMFVEVIEVHISVSFEFYLDEEFIEFWWADLMFESPHATICYRIPTLQLWVFLVIQEHSDIILLLSWIFFLYDEDFKILIWFIIDAIIPVGYVMSFSIFSSKSCLLASILSFMMINW